MIQKKAPFRIAVFIPSKRVGGAQIQLVDLSVSLKNKGHDVLLMSNTDELHTPDLSIKVVTTEDEMVEVLQKFNAEFVVFSNAVMPMIACELMKTPPKLVEVVQSNRKLETEANYYSPDFTDHHVFVSESARQFFYQQLQDDRATVIYNGIDLNRFSAKIDRRNRKNMKIMTVGSIKKEGKRSLDLIEVIRAFPQPDIQFIHLGDGTDRELLLNALGPEIKNKKFKHVTWTNDPASYYSDSDLFISFSEHEGYGLAIAEAAASGLPILLRPCYGISTYFQDGVQAFLCRETKEFIEKARLIYADRSLGIQMGKSAREMIEKKFSHEKMIQGYLNLFEKLRS